MRIFQTIVSELSPYWLRGSNNNRTFAGFRAVFCARRATQAASYWTLAVFSPFMPDAKPNVPDPSGRAHGCNRAGADRAAKISAVGHGHSAAKRPNRGQNSGREKSATTDQSSRTNAGRNHSSAGGQESAAFRHRQHGHLGEALGRFLFVCQWRLDQTHANSPGIFPLGQLQSVNRKK